MMGGDGSKNAKIAKIEELSPVVEKLNKMSNLREKLIDATVA